MDALLTETQASEPYKFQNFNLHINCYTSQQGTCILILCELHDHKKLWKLLCSFLPYISISWGFLHTSHLSMKDMHLWQSETVADTVGTEGLPFS
jgi:hypothetical protein